MQINKHVVIRTNGGKLVVNAANDTVRHYGTLAEADVQNIASESYHEFGAVNLLKVGTGHIEIEENAFVLKAEGNMTQVTIAPTAQVLQKGGEAATSLKISSTKQIEAFRDAVNAGIRFEGLTVELTADITLNNGWTPINGFMGAFDGKEHTISNLNTNGLTQTSDNSYAYGFFGTLPSGGEISNINFTNVNIVTTGEETGNMMAKRVGALVGKVNGIRNFSNITVNGYVELGSGAKGGGIIGGWEGSKEGFDDSNITVSGLTNNAEVNGKGAGAVAGVVGFINEQFYNSLDLTFVLTNCINTGHIHTTGRSAAGICVCNGQTNMPKLGVYKPDKTYSHGENQYTGCYENDCYNIGRIEALSEEGVACSLIKNDGTHTNSINNPAQYVNYFGDKWYQNTVVINNDPTNTKTFIPIENVTSLDCGISNTFTYNGTLYKIERTLDGVNDGDKIVTVTPQTN